MCGRIEDRRNLPQPELLLAQEAIARGMRFVAAGYMEQTFEQRVPLFATH